MLKLMSRTRFVKPHLALGAYRRTSLVIGCIDDLPIRDFTTRSALSVSEWSIEYWLTGAFLAVLHMGCLLLSL